MAIREDLVVSAVTFLQDPSVSASPLENRIAFLQSKNLTQEEIDAALARAGGGSISASQYSNYGPPQVATQPPVNYGGYQQHPWQQHPPDIPRRDWRDWFIMATVVSGVSYGLYTVAKRYVIPLIAPPTPPQLEQDKQAIDESFEKAFALLDQLSRDTEALKASEQARTERLDTALTEVETVIGELKSSSRRREEESQRIGDEVRGLKDLIPKAMEGHKELTDTRLRELNTELKSLKMLMGQRMNPPSTSAPTPTSFIRHPALSSNTGSTPSTTPSVNATGTTPSSNQIADSAAPKSASVSSPTGTEAVASLQGRSGSPFSAGIPSGRAAIPAWQMAAASKSTSTLAESGTASQEASSSS